MSGLNNDIIEDEKTLSNKEIFLGPSGPKEDIKDVNNGITELFPPSTPCSIKTKEPFLDIVPGDVNMNTNLSENTHDYLNLTSKNGQILSGDHTDSNGCEPPLGNHHSAANRVDDPTTTMEISLDTGGLNSSSGREVVTDLIADLDSGAEFNHFDNANEICLNSKDALDIATENLLDFDITSSSEAINNSVILVPSANESQTTKLKDETSLLIDNQILLGLESEINTNVSLNNQILESPLSVSSTDGSPSSQIQSSQHTESLTDKIGSSLSLEELTENLLLETEPKTTETVSAESLYEKKCKDSESSAVEWNGTPLEQSSECHTGEISGSSPVNRPFQSPTESPSRFLGQPGTNGLSILSHPAYKTAMQDLLSMKEQVGALKLECERLEKEKQELEADRSPDIFQLQLETLERTVAQQSQDLEMCKDEGRRNLEAAAATLAASRQIADKLKRDYDEANREREATVVRYAVSERELLRLKEEIHLYERRALERERERDVLMSKLKTAAAEKSRACHALDNKCSEVSNLHKEMEKMKDEMGSRDIKIKWAQNKIRSEIDAHKETQQKLDKMMSKVAEAREEAEQVRKDCQVMVRSCQQGREDRNHSLELQVQEQKAQLIAERHARQDCDESRKAALAEVSDLKIKYQQLLDENNTLCLKVQSLEKNRLEAEKKSSAFLQAEEQRRQLLADNESFRLQLQQQEERLSASQTEVERLRQSSSEHQQDAAACREREAELLAYTQKLTDKVVRLQSESSATQARAQQMEAEREPLAKKVAELEQKLSACETSLETEKRTRKEESQLLARKLAEKQEKAEKMAAQLEEAQGECAVLRRKQNQGTKELTRELMQCRKRLDQFESSGSNSLGQTSRASSFTSLNALEQATSKHQDSSSSHSQQALDPQMLIEHIGKIQRKNARLEEKVEFLEEHSRTLTLEMQRKTRLIQGLITRDEGGALSSRASDRSKLVRALLRTKSQVELSKHGGVMASLYTSTPADNNMTLELSLEINRKLQLVLEDTLLKNMTLKDNMDTLGKEIERLTSQVNSMKRSKAGHS